MAAPSPEDFRNVWESKAVLRTVYGGFHRAMLESCAPGRTLEIGAGSGNLKDLGRDFVSIDIREAPWIDIVADANHLPFPDRYFANLVLFDVLHHLPRPVGFFTEAERVLQSGGRLVMMEPAITPVSRIFYTFMHPEPVVWDCDPLDETALLSGPAPLDANQAVPSLLFGRHRSRFEQRFPSLKVLTVRKTGLFAYPLSGGFRRWSLIPGWAAAALMRVEPVLEPVLGPVMAFRLHVVVERL